MPNFLVKYFIHKLIIMANEGGQLEKYMSDKHLSAYRLAAELNLTAQNVYYHLKKDEISTVFKERLARAGHNLFNLPIRPDRHAAVTAEAANHIKSFDIERESLEKEIAYLKQLLAAKDELIKVKDEVITAFKEALYFKGKK